MSDLPTVCHFQKKICQLCFGFVFGHMVGKGSMMSVQYLGIIFFFKVNRIEFWGGKDSEKVSCQAKTRNIFLSVLLRRLLLRPILTPTHGVLSDMVGETMIFAPACPRKYEHLLLLCCACQLQTQSGHTDQNKTEQDLINVTKILSFLQSALVHVIAMHYSVLH